MKEILDQVKELVGKERLSQELAAAVVTAASHREVAQALHSIAAALHKLGTGNASTDKGAIEVLSAAIGGPDGQNLAEAVQAGLGEIAEAVAALKK